MTLVERNYVLMIGGIDLNFDQRDSVHKYTLEQGEWVKQEEQPKLLQTWYNHASCCANDAVYVFGGFGLKNLQIDPIERLSLTPKRDSYGSKIQNQWE